MERDFISDETIKIEDNTGVVISELNRKMPDLLNEIGNELMFAIKDFMIEDRVYDTGRLYHSISFSTPFSEYAEPSSFNESDDFITGIKEKDSVVYGSNVEYAS